MIVAGDSTTAGLGHQIGDRRHTFNTDFTIGREGSLAIDDDFASALHAGLQAVGGLWYT